MRLFTPYKRRKRNQLEGDHVKKKRPNALLTEDDSENEETVIQTKEEPWSTSDTIDASSDYLEASPSM